MKSIAIAHNLPTARTYEHPRWLEQAAASPFLAYLATYRGPHVAALRVLYSFVSTVTSDIQHSPANERAALLAEYRENTQQALETKHSITPLLQAFTEVAHTYKLEAAHIHAFLGALQHETTSAPHTKQSYQEYVQGMFVAPALMAWRIMCYKDSTKYHRLAPSVASLASAIGKITLINELSAHSRPSNHLHLPEVDRRTLNAARLAELIVDAQADLRRSRVGLTKLPRSIRSDVAGLYGRYRLLLGKLRQTTPNQLLKAPLQLSKLGELGLKFQMRFAPQSLLK